MVAGFAEVADRKDFLVAGGGFVPQSLIETSEHADSMMVGNAEKDQNGKFFIQLSFSFRFHRFQRRLPLGLCLPLMLTQMFSPRIHQKYFQITIRDLSIAEHRPPIRNIATVRDQYMGGKHLLEAAQHRLTTMFLPTSGRLSMCCSRETARIIPTARRLNDLSEADRTERMIGGMNEVHPGLRQHLETVVTKSWQSDPWQKGAYTVHHPGQLEWYPAICKREGKVWFAGEHASPWPTWMQGALASGIKATREINANLAEQIKPTLKLM
jgi:Flavin containing amine oxidoreductase